MDWTALDVSLWLGAGTIALLLPVGIWFGRVLATRAVSRQAARRGARHRAARPAADGARLLPARHLRRALAARSGVPGHRRALAAVLVRRVCCSRRPSPTSRSSSSRSSAASKRFPRDVRDAAACCGLTPWQRFLRIELPLAWPGILTAAILTFAHTLGEFGVVLMVGGNLPGETRTLSVAIYDRMQAFDDRSAGVMAATLLVDRGGDAHDDDGAVATRGSRVVSDRRLSVALRQAGPIPLDVEFTLRRRATCSPSSALGQRQDDDPAQRSPACTGRPRRRFARAATPGPTRPQARSRRRIGARSASSSRSTRSFRI